MNKQLRVCAAHRGWNTNIRQKENHLRKGQQMRSRENWHIFHHRELILWHLCHLHHCSEEEVDSSTTLLYMGVQPPRTHSSYLIVTTSRPFSLPGPSLPRHFSFGIFLETLPICSLVGLFPAHWNSSQGLQCNKIIQNTNTNKNLSTNKNRGQR